MVNVRLPTTSRILISISDSPLIHLVVGIISMARSESVSFTGHYVVKPRGQRRTPPTPPTGGAARGFGSDRGASPKSLTERSVQFQ